MKNWVVWFMFFAAGFALGIYSTPTAHAASWDTAGNNVTVNDRIGTTNYLPFKIMNNNVDRVSINVDGLRFLSPLFYITNSNGQFVMGHNSTTGCTTIFGQVSNMINMCNNRVEVLGAPLVAKSNYTIAPNTAYTLLATDETVEMESGDFILPDATPTNKGKRYELINTGDSQIPVQSSSGQMIGNNIQEAQYIIPPGGSVALKSNGTMWRIIANKI